MFGSLSSHKDFIQLFSLSIADDDFRDFFLTFVLNVSAHKGELSIVFGEEPIAGMFSFKVYFVRVFGISSERQSKVLSDVLTGRPLSLEKFPGEIFWVFLVDFERMAENQVAISIFGVWILDNPECSIEVLFRRDKNAIFNSKLFHKILVSVFLIEIQESEKILAIKVLENIVSIGAKNENKGRFWHVLDENLIFT